MILLVWENRNLFGEKGQTKHSTHMVDYKSIYCLMKNILLVCLFVSLPVVVVFVVVSFVARRGVINLLHFIRIIVFSIIQKRRCNKNDFRAPVPLSPRTS